MAKIYCDTREQTNDYILDDFKSYGIKFEVQALKDGDYVASDNPNCVIDLKFGILELQKNIAGNEAQRSRFLNEIMRCVTNEKKLIVLIREPVIYNVYGVQFWKSPKNKRDVPYTKVSGKYIMKIMQTYEKEYGIEWRFCKKQDAARAIVSLLKSNGGLND